MERTYVKLSHKLSSCGELQAVSLGEATSTLFLAQCHSNNARLPSCFLSSQTPPPLPLSLCEKWELFYLPYELVEGQLGKSPWCNAEHAIVSGNPHRNRQEPQRPASPLSCFADEETRKPRNCQSYTFHGGFRFDPRSLDSQSSFHSNKPTPADCSGIKTNP